MLGLTPMPMTRIPHTVRHRFATTLSAAIVWLAPLTVGAQVRPQVAPLVTSEVCRDYQNFTPKALLKNLRPRAADEIAATLQGCFLELRGALDELASSAASKTSGARPVGPTVPTDTPPSQKQIAGTRMLDGASAAQATIAQSATTTDTYERQVHVALVKAYLAFRNLQRWKTFIDEQATKSDSRSGVVTAFNGLAEQLQDVLARHGLTQPFAATLVTAFALTSAGGAATEPAASPNGTAAGGTGSGDTSTEAAGFVNWQSIHFYAAPDRPFDVSVAGTFGFQPVLAIVQPAPDQAGSPGQGDGLTTKFQQAFVWSVAAQPNWRVADLAEVSVFGRVGQSILSAATTLNQNTTPPTVDVAPSGGSRAELFTEFGAGISIYGRSLELLHLNRGLLTPMFAFSAGLRRDNRFTVARDLLRIASPEQRVFLRVQVDGLQLENRGAADKPFTIGLSVDFDGPLHQAGTALPSGTRILIRGDLNLFKAAQSQK